METTADPAQAAPSSEPSLSHPPQPPSNPLPIPSPAEEMPAAQPYATDPSGFDPNPLRPELSGESVELSSQNTGASLSEIPLVDEKMEKIAFLGGSDGLPLEMVDAKMDEETGALRVCVLDQNPVRSVLSGERLEVSNPEPDACLSQIPQVGFVEEVSNSPIDEKMEKVALICSSEDIPVAMVDFKMGGPPKGGDSKDKDVSEGKGDEESDVGSSEESESEESSTGSSSDDEVESGGERDEVAPEVEEGEMRGVFSDDEEEEVVAKGPIKSKHEIDVLPPVPRVEVSLEPHHQALPVGVILSIVGNRVIVEGSEKHNPLNEGSVLWITDSRLPLGVIDEIFGPVKNPYYVVRYNSEEEIPVGINVGMGVFFVPEFADHILNLKDLQKKGYDASGDNDEEVTDEVEFSDDEKEAEYRRSQRQAKRGTDDRRPPKQRNAANKKTNFNGARSHDKMQALVSHVPTTMIQPRTVGPGSSMESLVTQNSAGNGMGYSFGAGQSLGSTASIVSALPQTMQHSGCLMDLSHQLMQQPNALLAPGFLPQQQSNAWVPQQLPLAWAHGLLPQQQHMGMHHSYMSGFPNQQIGDNTHHQQHPAQGTSSYPIANQFQQQFFPNPGGSSNMPWFGGPINHPFGSLPIGMMGPGTFSQMPGGVDYMHNLGVLGFSNLQSQVHSQQGSLQGGMHPPSQFDLGSSAGRGTKPNTRGGRGGRRSFDRGGQHWR